MYVTKQGGYSDGWYRMVSWRHESWTVYLFFDQNKDM